MLKVDILTKESCGGIPSYDHFISIVFVSQGGRFQARVYRLPRYVPQRFTELFQARILVLYFKVCLLVMILAHVRY